MKSAASLVHQWLALSLYASLFFIAAPAMAQTASLTYSEGGVTLLRGAATFTAAVGAKLDTGDMIQTGATGQAQLEFTDGLILNLGADSKFYMLNAGAPGKPSQFALAAGWLKAAIPAGRKGDARQLEYLLPSVAIETTDATLVMHAAPDINEMFLESGTASVTDLAHDGARGKAVTAKGSDYVSRKGDGPVAVGRPPATFLSGMPRHYKDNLPVLYAKMKDKASEPTRDHDTTYAEASAWLNANGAVRQGLVARYQPRAKDAEFRAGLDADMNEHPEWQKVLGGTKPAPKKK
jgi:hypothetical protein